MYSVILWVGAVFVAYMVVGMVLTLLDHLYFFGRANVDSKLHYLWLYPLTSLLWPLFVWWTYEYLRDTPDCEKYHKRHKKGIPQRNREGKLNWWWLEYD